MSGPAWRSQIGLFGLLGCGAPRVPVDDGNGTGTEGSSTSVSASTGASGAASGTSGSHGTSEDDDGLGFIVQPELTDPRYGCTPYLQDCPKGEKCNFWTDGGAAYNATKCVPVVPDPDALGEPCSAEENGATGHDSCERGAICMLIDAETERGTCIGYCDGNLECKDPEAHCEGRDLALCVPRCCPVEQACPDGEACYPNQSVFVCYPDASGPELGAYGDPCEFVNTCDRGLFCVGADLLPDCAGAACCTPFCSIEAPDCERFDPALTCVPWYAEGGAPPGEEHVGGCMIP